MLSVISQTAYKIEDHLSHNEKIEEDSVQFVIPDLIKAKHEEYLWNAKVYRAMYYFNRVLAGFSVGFLPIVVTRYSEFTIVLSISLIVATVLDFVFNPKKRWKTFSQATDRLAIAELKTQAEYKKYKEFFNILCAIESEAVEVNIRVVA